MFNKRTFNLQADSYTVRRKHVLKYVDNLCTTSAIPFVRNKLLYSSVRITNSIVCITAKSILTPLGKSFPAFVVKISWKFRRRVYKSPPPPHKLTVYRNIFESSSHLNSLSLQAQLEHFPSIYSWIFLAISSIKIFRTKFCICT
jgi:hypothetical protein